MTGVAAVPDLTGEIDLTLALLDDTWAWRQRLLETFEFRSTHYVRVRSSYQVVVPSKLVAPFLGGAAVEGARLRLPVTTRPKDPLVGFNVLVNDARGYLPLRSVIGAVQAAYLQRLVDRAAVSEISVGLPPDMLDAICSFAPGVARGFEAPAYTVRLARYLRSGLGFPVGAGDVRTWRRELQPAARVLAEALDEPADRWSSTEQVLLALPLLDPRPASVDDVTERVTQYAAAVEEADRVGAWDLLLVLADYGRRWEVLVDAAVPLDKPFLVKIEEDRPLGLRWSGHCRQRLWLGDAPSYHLEARTLDPAVVFDLGPQVVEPDGTKVGFGYWEGRRLTSDAIALYTSDPDRPYFVDLWIRLRPIAGVRALSLVVEVLAVMALLFLALVDLGEDKVGELAVLTVPTSFAMALLGIREHTSLAAHLQRFRRTRLLVEMVALWFLAIHQLFFRPL